MTRPLRICKVCRREKEHHAKGMCFYCYRRFAWTPKKRICKKCGRLKIIKAREHCSGCYSTVFQLEYNKAWNHMKNYDLDYKTYKQITAKCLICGFDKYVHLHHLDHNRHNNNEKNMIGLCPNHHQMLHTIKYQEEVFAQINKALQEKELPLTIPELTNRPEAKLNNFGGLMIK